VHELIALFGWLTPQMAAHYTREANRRRLAQQAAAKLARQNKKANSMPSPTPKVRARAEKEQ
jgi:hypothetical protein